MSHKILVTGAGGFVGPYLIRELQKNAEHEIFASIYSATSDIAGLLPGDHVIEGDLTDAKYCQDLVKRSSPDVIYHLAALSDVKESEGAALHVLTANTEIQYNMLEAVKSIAPLARFVAVCSANVYGLVGGSEVPINESQPLRPLNPYAVSKLTQEFLTLQYHLSYGLNTVILRPFNHTGVGQTENFVIPALVRQFVQIKRGLQAAQIEIGNTASIRDFTDVRDMVRAYILSSTKCESGQVYNIGSGKGSSIAQIIELLQDISGIKVEVLTSKERVRHSDVPVLIADNTKFVTATSWLPEVKFHETLSSVYNSMVNN